MSASKRAARHRCTSSNSVERPIALRLENVCTLLLPPTTGGASPRRSVPGPERSMRTSDSPSSLSSCAVRTLGQPSARESTVSSDASSSGQIRRHPGRRALRRNSARRPPAGIWAAECASAGQHMRAAFSHTHSAEHARSRAVQVRARAQRSVSSQLSRKESETRISMLSRAVASA
eukprot:scaffold49329_cov35-Tisochrysis_lutea.AAC.1